MRRPATPVGHLEKWKKLWGTPRLLDAPAVEAALEEFYEAVVPTHMHKKFLQFFGTYRAKFGNRFFVDQAGYHDWATPLSAMGFRESAHVEATVIYASGDTLEAHCLRGQPRRSLRDIVLDDWNPACAIVRAAEGTLFVFVEPKMRGCIVVNHISNSAPPADEE